MISQQQIIEILKGIAQKNSPDASSAALLPMGAPDLIQSRGGKPSVLGFLGGLGDTQNDRGGIDPSFLSRMNQRAMGEMGQGNGGQPFPWQQQPQGQQIGQNMTKTIMSILNFL